MRWQGAAASTRARLHDVGKREQPGQRRVIVERHLVPLPVAPVVVPAVARVRPAHQPAVQRPRAVAARAERRRLRALRPRRRTRCRAVVRAAREAARAAGAAVPDEVRDVHWVGAQCVPQLAEGPRGGVGRAVPAEPQRGHLDGAARVDGEEQRRAERVAQRAPPLQPAQPARRPVRRAVAAVAGLRRHGARPSEWHTSYTRGRVRRWGPPGSRWSQRTRHLSKYFASCCRRCVASAQAGSARSSLSLAAALTSSHETAKPS